MSPPTMNARLTELQAEVERLRDKGHTGTTNAPDPAELARKLREIRSGYTHDHLSDSPKEALRQAETFLEPLASTQPKTIFGLPVVIDDPMPPDTFKIVHPDHRSDERRVGEEGGSTISTQWSQYH